MLIIFLKKSKRYTVQNITDGKNNAAILNIS
jgi:hypothetical protein